jgi:hypothetical protein
MMQAEFPTPAFASGCEQFRRQWNRREILTAGGLCGVGLLLPDFFRAQARESTRDSSFGRARSVIVLYLHGGHAQQETWDPKPSGPEPARGEFGAIATRVPGTYISELLPNSARIMDKLAIIRSLSHGNANHVQASLTALTGHAHPPEAQSRGDFPPSPTDFPPFGAVLSSLRRSGPLPTWVQVGPLMRRNNGTVLHGQLPGFLGARHNPLVIDQDLRPRDVRLEAVSVRAEVPALRLQARGRLLDQVEGQRRRLDRLGEASSFDDHHRRAMNLLSSSATARAFALAEEPVAVRERYGRTQFGQCCLLARRLAEAGVPMTTVHFCQTPVGSWDTHSRHFPQMKDWLCPIFDRALSALVSDLDQRGLLDRTLVLATAEFGRTPQVNRSGGRDHWPWVYSVALAGGGTRQGVVYGASDHIAAFPTAQPHDPRDLAATVYHLLGIPTHTTVHDAANRPYALIVGQKIDGLVS